MARAQLKIIITIRRQFRLPASTIQMVLLYYKLQGPVVWVPGIEPGNLNMWSCVTTTWAKATQRPKCKPVFRELGIYLACFLHQLLKENSQNRAQELDLSVLTIHCVHCPIIIVNIARIKRLSSHLLVVPYSGNLSWNLFLFSKPVVHTHSS